LHVPSNKSTMSTWEARLVKRSHTMTYPFHTDKSIPRRTMNTTLMNMGDLRAGPLESVKSASRSGTSIAPSTAWIMRNVTGVLYAFAIPFTIG
jgi:hypothetical protein